MNKEKIIKKNEEFTKIINKNQSVKSKYFSIYYQLSDKNHYGITVPTKIGHAVVRNKLKRRVKNIIYNNEKDIQQGFNYVIIIKEATKSLDYAGLEKELLYIIKKAR